MWDAVPGQDHAVATLRARRRHRRTRTCSWAHVGPAWSRRARAFAAEIVGATDERRGARGTWRASRTSSSSSPPPPRTRSPTRSARRVQGRPPAATAALPRVIPEIHKAPIEGDRKVVMVRDADRMEEVVGNTLLKSIEEPPPRTVILLLTDRPDGLLATIRSRCQRVDFAYAPPVRSADIDAVRVAFAAVVPHVDGRAATTVALVEELEAALERAGAATEAAAAATSSRRSTRTSRRVGIRRVPRPRCAVDSPNAQRQEQRRARTDALIEGISGIEQTYLDVLADAAERGPGRPGARGGRARRVPRGPAGRRVQPQRRVTAAAPRVAVAGRRLIGQEVRPAETPWIHCRTPPG